MERAVEIMTQHAYHGIHFFNIDFEKIWQEAPCTPLQDFQEITVRSLQYGLKHAQGSQSLSQEVNRLKDENQVLYDAITKLEQQINNLTNTVSWKITQPLRSIRQVIGRPAS